LAQFDLDHRSWSGDILALAIACRSDFNSVVVVSFCWYYCLSLNFVVLVAFSLVSLDVPKGLSRLLTG
jgi:hypothetical protein